MRQYTDQPKEDPVTEDNINYIIATISSILTEELPDCDINDWFLRSVHFANMMDKIKEDIQDDQD